MVTVREDKLSRLDAGGLLYGTIVSAAALAAGAGRGDTAARMIETMASTLIIYWLAHVYIATMSGRGSGSAAPLHRVVRKVARKEAAILAGGLPVLAAAVILSAAGVTLWVTVLCALGTAVAMLALGGFLAGRHEGARGWRLGAQTATASILGGLIALLLVALHH